MLSTTRIDVSLITSIKNKEIKMVLCNIYVAEFCTVNDISSACPDSRIQNHCHLATDLVTILKQICQKLWENITHKSER